MNITKEQTLSPGKVYWNRSCTWFTCLKMVNVWLFNYFPSLYLVFSFLTNYFIIQLQTVHVSKQFNNDVIDSQLIEIHLEDILGGEEYYMKTCIFPHIYDQGMLSYVGTFLVKMYLYIIRSTLTSTSTHIHSNRKITQINKRGKERKTKQLLFTSHFRSSRDSAVGQCI